MITREADYAIRCILYMSQKEEGLFSVKDISGAMDIPQSFLAKILQKLLKSDIVVSVRGAGGGFRLKRSPSDISLYDVVVAIDGTLSLNKCVDDPSTCDQSNDCVVHPIWVDVSADLDNILKGKTFDRLASQYVKNR